MCSVFKKASACIESEGFDGLYTTFDKKTRLQEEEETIEKKIKDK